MFKKYNIGKLLNKKLLKDLWNSKWGKRSIIGFLVMALVTVSIAWPESSQKVVRKEWAVVNRGPFVVDLVESGEIVSLNEAIVTAPMMFVSSLQIIDLVPEGAMVKKGDFLVQFDITDLQERLDLEIDALISLKADLDKLKAQQALTTENLDDQLILAQYETEQAKLRLQMRQFESDAKKEEARLQLKQAEIDLERVGKQIKSQKIIHTGQIMKSQLAIHHRQGHVKEYQDQIQWFTLTAPVDGMVVYREVGSFGSRERLKKGYTARPREELISIPDMESMQIELYINEVDRLKVRPGLDTEITMDAYPDLKLQGKVVEVARLAQQVALESELKGFVMLVDIEGSDPRLKPGMTARVRIVLEKNGDVLYIPVGTVFEVDGQPVVYRKGKSSPNAITLGSRNDAYVIVTDGLKEGMQLSWNKPGQKADMLGMVEEKKRIDKIRGTLNESFAVFEDRGILYPYFQKETEASSGNTEQKSDIDISKLPPSIRERLMQQKKEDAEPRIEVGTPESPSAKGTFKLSPEMMERLKKSDTENPSSSK